MSLTQVPSVVLGISQTKKLAYVQLEFALKNNRIKHHHNSTRQYNHKKATKPILSSGVFNQTMLFFIVNFFQ